MEELDPVFDDNDFDIKFYNTELLEDTNINNSNDKLNERTKPNIVAGDSFCKYFCGTDCKYCKPIDKFPPEKMVLKGLYSTWVTSNILAMARPNNKYIEEYNIIEQFKNHGIKSIINMQMSGEHSHCGYPLDKQGFSYNYETFMKNGIEYLHFPCEDFGAIPVNYLFNNMQHLQHRLTFGKVAVHCHAGHGRTGMIIACYLIFSNRINGIHAINYVRKKRPGAVQNQLQVDTVLAFAKYMQPFTTVCLILSQPMYKFSLQEAVMRQNKFIHGPEADVLKYVPKIIFLCLRKISSTDQDEVDNNLFDLVDARSSNETPSIISTFQDLAISNNFRERKHYSRWIKIIKSCFKKPFTKCYARNILAYLNNPDIVDEEINEIKKGLNEGGEMWKKVYNMSNVEIHCKLMSSWFDELKFPVLRTPDIEHMETTEFEDIVDILLRLESIVGKTLIMVLEFLDQFQILTDTDKWHLYSIIFSRLTHKNVNFLGGFDRCSFYKYDLDNSLTNIIQNVILFKM